MIRHILYAIFLLASIGAAAQTRLYVRGSAVPGGIQELERFTTTSSTTYVFKFHGTLLPGNLYITTTSEPKASSYYLKPRYVDTNIVCAATTYTNQRDSIGAEWSVLFEADNYRFTVTPSAKTVEGELFAPWYEAWLCGGCVEDEQGKDTEPGHWQITSGKAMEQDWENPYIWTWTGELKNYTYNDEPKRFKINGQYGWSPKVLHPFTQDASILTAKYVWYNGSSDYKWSIAKDGYYRITVDVFRETIKGEYLGTELPDGILVPVEAEAGIEVCGSRIVVRSAAMLRVKLFSCDGTQRLASFGTHVTLDAPAPGLYILYATDGEKSLTRKIIVE